MDNYFPAHAHTNHQFNQTSCTVEISDETGAPICLNQLKQIATGFTNEPIILLHFGHTAIRNVRVDLLCGSKLVTQQESATSKTPLFYECSEAVSVGYEAAIATDIESTLTYATSSSSMNATSSPYIISEFYQNGVSYKDIPLLGQIGIALWILTFAVFVTWIIKIFRKV